MLDSFTPETARMAVLNKGKISLTNLLKEKEMEIPKSFRYRVNISTSVKGVKTWDCTVDAVGYPMAEVLDSSDTLVKELEQRYPITEVK